MTNNNNDKSVQALRKSNLSHLFKKVREDFNTDEAISYSMGEARTAQASYQEFFRQLSNHITDIIDHEPIIKDEFYNILASNLESILQANELPTPAQQRGELYDNPTERQAVKNLVNHLADSINAEWMEFPQGKLTYQAFSDLVSVKKLHYDDLIGWKNNPADWNARRYEVAILALGLNPKNFPVPEPTFNDLTDYEVHKMKQACQPDSIEHVEMWEKAKQMSDDGNDAEKPLLIYKEYMRLYEGRVERHLPASTKNTFLARFTKDLREAILPQLHTIPELPEYYNEGFVSMKAELATHDLRQRLEDFLEDKRREASKNERQKSQLTESELEISYLSTTLENIAGVIIEKKAVKTEAIRVEKNRSCIDDKQIKDFNSTMPVLDREVCKLIQEFPKERTPQEKMKELEIQRDRIELRYASKPKSVVPAFPKSTKKRKTYKKR